jgi:light-regulated signal transduction histidine kinase (bacteriophytochrome)
LLFIQEFPKNIHSRVKTKTNYINKANFELFMAEYILKCPPKPLEEIELLTIANLRRGHDYKIALNLLTDLPAYMIEDGEILEKEKLLSLLRTLQTSATHVKNIDFALQTIIDPKFSETFQIKDVANDLGNMLSVRYGAYQQPEININGTFSMNSHPDLLYMQLYNQLRNAQQSCTQQPSPRIHMNISSHKLTKKELGYTGENQFTQEKSFVKIDITDNGFGIDEVLLPDIFKRGVSTKLTRGIGLALSGQTCHLLKGFIKVNSELGKGTTFSMYLPQEI